MLCGTVMAIGSGAAFPLMTVIFGSVDLRRAALTLMISSLLLLRISLMLMRMDNLIL